MDGRLAAGLELAAVSGAPSGRKRASAARTYVLILSLLSLALPALAAPAGAASSPEPARLVGDKIGVDLEAKVARAEGNVVLTYKDIKITCDLLEVNTSSGELVATGNVTVYDDDDIVTGSVLKYDLKARRGTIAPGKATVTGEGIKGNMYVSGAEFAAEPGKITVTSASFTTCDLEEPHYHVEAGEIELYIDDRMVLRQVSYWEGKLRLFYWPYLVWPIREENRFDLPKIGYSPTEGWFVKTTYNYYRSPSYRGSLYLDYFSNLGAGVGVKHLYQAGALGSGFVYVYELANRITDHADGKLEISHKIPFLDEKATATLGLRYSDSLSSSGVLNTYLTGVIGVDYRDGRSRLNLSLENTTKRGDVSSDEAKALIQGDGKFEGGLTLSGKVSFLDRRTWDVTDPGEKFLNYRFEATKDLDVASVRATVEQYVKPREQREKEEEGEVEPVPYEAIGRSPEVVIESRPFGLGPLPLRLQVAAGYGMYAERSSSSWAPDLVRATRTELALLAPLQSYPLWDGARGTFSGGVTFDSYSTGDTRYVAGANLGFETRALRDALTFRMGYEYRGVFGDTPFAFDAKSRTGLLTGSLSLGSGIVSCSVEGGYDFYTRLYKDLAGRMRISSPGRPWAVEARATYSPNDAAMKDAVGKIEFSPSERWNIKLGAKYSFPGQALDRVESEVMLKLSDTWKVEWVLVYGGPASSKGVLRGDVAVTRDLHCRELKLSYSHTQKQVWLEYRIKAFPYEGLRFGLGDQGVLF